MNSAFSAGRKNEMPSTLKLATVWLLPRRLRTPRLPKGLDPAERSAARVCAAPAPGAEVDRLIRHAAVRGGAEDHERLGQPCRYITRPAISNERVLCNAAGRWS